MGYDDDPDAGVGDMPRPTGSRVRRTLPAATIPDAMSSRVGIGSGCTFTDVCRLGVRTTQE
jgi:hypothetical protein